MTYIEKHRCKKHGPYECTIWSEKPTCPKCWEEKQDSKKNKEVGRTYGVTNLVQLIREHKDFYTSLASQIFLKPEFEVSKEERDAVKKDFLDFMLSEHKKVIGG